MSTGSTTRRSPETLPVIDAKGNTTASIFTVSYLTDGENGSARPVRLCLQWRGPVRPRSFCISGALGPADPAGPPEKRRRPRPRRFTWSINPATWLGFYRSGLCRPGRHRVQPRQREGGKSGQAVSGMWRARYRLSRLGDPPVAHPASALDIAGSGWVGESYGGFRAAAMGANPCRTDFDVIVKGPRPGLSGARPLGLASDRNAIFSRPPLSCPPTPPPPQPTNRSS